MTTVPITQWGFLRGQNDFLADKGFEIHAISSPGAYLEALADRDKVATHPVPIARTISPLQDLASVWKLFRVLRKLRPAIAHVSTPKGALLGAVAAYAARVPVRIYCLRGSITEPASGLRRMIFRSVERFTARLCHQTICVSESLLDFARTESILPKRAGMVAAKGMSNGIDVDRFDAGSVDPAGMRALPESLQRVAQDRSTIVIGYVGRLARDKGIENLWQAWTTLREAYANAHLILAGSWEEEAKVSPECRRALESDARVHIVGHVEDIVPYYRLMSFCVFPSFGSEGFPNAPMEAAAMRLPVIATRVVGSVDAVDDGVTGMLVPPRDTSALLETMRTYLGDPDLRRRHGDAGCVRVRRDFRQEAVWEALHQEYVRLLRERGLPVGGDTLAADAPRLGTAFVRGERT
ncbi:MAG TPA: glycosyltransferase family 4 protein [Vicinamibacterales bacterium]|nr:glycosyltransferase family 4 protein [Vicinamibacterales bacterium]